MGSQTIACFVVLLVVSCASATGSAPRVEFVGNHAMASSELSAVTQIDDGPAEGPNDAEKLERDILMLQAAYYDRGYLQATVDVVTLDASGVVFRVREGKRFKLASLEVSEAAGDTDRLRSMIPVQAGDWFNRAAIASGLEHVIILYRDAGYAHIEANPEVMVDDQHAVARILVPIRRGPLVHFERVDVVGNRKLAKATIVRELGIRPGQRFNQTALERGLQRLRTTGDFTRVDLATSNLPGQRDKLIVTVEVVER